MRDPVKNAVLRHDPTLLLAMVKHGDSMRSVKNAGKIILVVMVGCRLSSGCAQHTHRELPTYIRMVETLLRYIEGYVGYPTETTSK